MSIILHYSKGQYEGKIAELEGLYNQLKTHLDRMENLKNQMYTFWEDDNARKTGIALQEEIMHVRSAMDQTSEMLTFYKKTVSELDGTNNSISGVLEDALSVIKTIF